MPPSISKTSGDPKNRIAFAISTRDRTDFTEKILPGLDCGGFDLIWCDGSETAQGMAFARADHFARTPLKEVHYNVTGGPDAVIQFSLKRLLALGYDKVGLIENDIQLKPGWLQAMLAAWEAAEEDGFKVGAATARSLNSRVYAHTPRYVVQWNLGAAMVLFSRAAAEAVLRDYQTTTAEYLQQFYQSALGVDLSGVWEMFMGKPDRNLGADWLYAASLVKRGLISVGTIPHLAENIDVNLEEYSGAKYIYAAADPMPAHCISIEQLKTKLQAVGASRPAAKVHLPPLLAAQSIRFSGDVHPTEGAFRWLGKRAELLLPAELTQQSATLSFNLSIGDLWCYGNQRMETTLRLNGRAISTLPFAKNQQSYSLALPVEVSAAPQELVIESTTSFVPARIDVKSNDQRQLAVKLQNLAFSPANPAATPTVQPNGRISIRSGLAITDGAPLPGFLRADIRLKDWPTAFHGGHPQRYEHNFSKYVERGGLVKPGADVYPFVAADGWVDSARCADMARYYFLCLAFDQIAKERLPGNFAELGVNKGHTAGLLAEFARRLDTDLYLFDTFEGFSQRDLKGVDAGREIEFADTSLEQVRSVVGEENTRFVKGYFPDSTSQIPDDLKFSLVHIDCDLYAPALSALEYFYPRMTPGGFMVVHDYYSLYWDGLEKAVDEFFQDKPEAVVPVPDASGSVVVRKLKK